MPRQFTEEEAQRVFARIAEMQGIGRSDEGTLTATELREAARAAGLDPSLVDIAVADLDAAPERRPEVFGAPAEVVRTQIVPGALDDDTWAQMVRVLRTEFDAPGAAGQIGRTREWSFTPRSGTGYTSATRVSAEPAAGGTRLTTSRSIHESVQGYVRGGSLEVLISLVLLAVSLPAGETFVLGGVSFGFLAALFMAIGLLLVGGAQIGARVWARQREAQFERVLGRLDLVARSSELERAARLRHADHCDRSWTSTISLTTRRTWPGRCVARHVWTALCDSCPEILAAVHRRAPRCRRSADAHVRQFSRVAFPARLWPSEVARRDAAFALSSVAKLHPMQRLFSALALPALVLAAGGCGPASLVPLSGSPSLRAVYVARDSVVARLDGIAIIDGGLSALDVGPDGALWSVSDRGPNLDAEAREGRPAKRFALPDYAPPIVRLALADGRLVVQNRRPILTPEGRPVTGRPPAAGDAAAGDAVEVETALGPAGEVLAPDPWGIDAEGLALDGDDLWVSDEYRPSIWRLDARTGRVRERFTPVPTEVVDRPLPPVIAGRQPNLGFEGLAVLDGFVIAALQGPLRTATSDPATPFVRLLRLDPSSGEASTFAYALDGPLRKVGDLAARPDGDLLVLEHGVRPDGRWSAEVYTVTLRSAAALGTAEPERFATVAEARAAGTDILGKRLVLDLVAAGWPPSLRKPEGLAVLADGRLAVLADNDYGVDAPASDGRPVATEARSTLVLFGVRP